MPKLNFYDYDAVKAFVLNILIENAELRQLADFERRQNDTWFKEQKEARERADAAEAKIAAATALLTSFQEARLGGAETPCEPAVADALALLNGGEVK